MPPSHAQLSHSLWRTLTRVDFHVLFTSQIIGGEVNFRRDHSSSWCRKRTMCRKWITLCELARDWECQTLLSLKYECRVTTASERMKDWRNVLLKIQCVTFVKLMHRFASGHISCQTPTQKTHTCKYLGLSWFLAKTYVSHTSSSRLIFKCNVASRSSNSRKPQVVAREWNAYLNLQLLTPSMRYKVMLTLTVNKLH